MNDLAEKALHGLDVARRQVVTHPLITFTVLGGGLSTTVVVAGGRVNAAQATRPLSTWVGLQDAHGARADDWLPGAVMLGAIVALVLLWLGVVGFVRRHDQPESRLWWLAGAWALPFVLGPPLLGTSVQSYAAFGLLQRHGLSPYDFGPNRLTGKGDVTAIEPAARGTHSSAGALGSLVQHLAVSAADGSALGAVLILRLLGVASAVLIGRFAAEIAGSYRARALTLTALNPLVLLHVVSAARFDGLMLAFVLAAVNAANQRRWVAAIMLACFAGSVSGQAFVVVPAIVSLHWLGRRRISGWALIGRDALIAAVTTAACGFAVPDGFGWLRTVAKQFSAHTPFAITSAVAKGLDPIVRGASYDDLAAGARITAVTAMVCVIAYLLGTARQRALERTAGYALLALALLAPVLYPWYLLWGTLCLAPAAAGTRRVAVIALCAAGCVLSPPGFSATTTNVLTGVSLAVAAVVVVSLPSVRRAARASVPANAGT